MILVSHDFDVLELRRYEIRLISCADTSLPEFLGSTFRGAFGHAFKAVACSMPHGDCNRCLLKERCLYTTVFDPTVRQQQVLLKNNQNTPRPFIFQPSFSSSLEKFGSSDSIRNHSSRGRNYLSAGDELKFELTLIGPAIENLPYIVYAISLMAQHGLGENRAPFELEEVSVIEADGKRTQIYTPEMTCIRPHTPAIKFGEMVQARLEQLPLHDTIKLRFLTPARIRTKNRVQETLSFEKLISSLSLRVALLAETFGTSPIRYNYQSLLSHARTVETSLCRLREYKLERLSNRQQTKLEMGGTIGEISYSDPHIADFLPLVIAGEFLHIGSGTVFGLGRFRVQV